MQKLPYVVVTNPHLSLVYELYYKSFESFRRVPEIKSVEDNDLYCKVIGENLKEHLAVIPNLVMGVLECRDLVQPDVMDDFIHAMLRAVSQSSTEKGFSHTDWNVIAHLSTCYCRAAPCAHGDFQLAVAYPANKLRVGLCGRGSFTM
jgi:Mitochondrial branched-chain alpha-ketoacid dehydrogenase kinase